MQKRFRTSAYGEPNLSEAHSGLYEFRALNSSMRLSVRFGEDSAMTPNQTISLTFTGTKY